MSISTVPSGTVIRPLADLGSAVKLSDDSADLLNKKIEPPPVGKLKADNDPINLYETIQKDGKTIATLYKSGLIVTPNGTSLPDNIAVDGYGTSLADTRIQQMMEMHGGSVKYTQETRTQNAAANAATLFAAQLAAQ